MKVGEAIRHALNGNALLFVGSGFSRFALNVRNEELPTGQHLATLLSTELGRDTNTTLDIIADQYLERHGENSLIQLLRGALSVKQTTEAQRTTLSLPWRRIYTTNYGDVVERASIEARNPFEPLVARPEQPALPGTSRVCVHLNGHIASLNHSTIHTEFKLTRSSYLVDFLTNSNWSFHLRYDVEISKAVVFVGYSLYDLDIQRILYQSEATKDKCVFITSTTPDEDTAFVVRKFGRLEPIGLDGLAARINEIRQTHVPVSSPPVYFSFRKEELEWSPSADIQDRDVFDLMMRGIIKRDIFAFCLQESIGDQYLILRSALGRVADALRRRGTSVIVHGNLGSGKTVLCAALALKLLRSGASVFWFERERADWRAELTDIMGRAEDPVIIVENYQRYLDVIRFYQARRSPKASLLLTARTAVHELNVGAVEDILGSMELLEFDVTKLDDTEVQALAKILSAVGLWRELARLSEPERFRYIKQRLNAELQAVLVALLESPDIVQRFKLTFEALAEHSDVSRLVVGTLVLDVLGATSLNVWQIAELVGVQDVNRVSLRQNAVLKEFIDLNGGTIYVRSPVLGKFILNHLDRSSIVVDTLVEMAGRLHAFADTERELEILGKELMRVANVEPILPLSQRRPMLISFYERTKNLPKCRMNPFFWLQYGIARLSIKDYERTEACLKTAYGLSERMDLRDNYQLNNYFARFILQRAIDTNLSEQSFSTFVEAHNLIRQQAGRQVNRHYPFRVALLYQDFYTQFVPGWSAPERARFKAACKEIIDCIPRLDARVRNHRNVVECGQVLSSIIV